MGKRKEKLNSGGMHELYQVMDFTDLFHGEQHGLANLEKLADGFLDLTSRKLPMTDRRSLFVLLYLATLGTAHGELDVF